MFFCLQDYRPGSVITAVIRLETMKHIFYLSLAAVIYCGGCNNSGPPLPTDPNSNETSRQAATASEVQTTLDASSVDDDSGIERSIVDLMPPGNAYTAYWLVSSKSDSDEYYEPLLVLTRVTFDKLQAQSELTAQLTPKLNPGENLPLMEASALCIETYHKDSIWNFDRRPIKAIGVVTDIDDQTNSITIDGHQFRAKQASVLEVISLLENPRGTKPLHRLHAPLAGAEQTTRALILLLKNQLKQR